MNNLSESIKVSQERLEVVKKEAEAAWNNGTKNTIICEDGNPTTKITTSISEVLTHIELSDLSVKEKVLCAYFIGTNCHWNETNCNCNKE